MREKQKNFSGISEASDSFEDFITGFWKQDGDYSTTGILAVNPTGHSPIVET
jgi:hypothetical protein